MILTSSEMRSLEAQVVEAGTSIEALMEEAGAQVANAVRQFFSRPGRVIVFAGKGHNGGDALVAARHLRQAGWEIKVRLAFPPDRLAALTRKKLQELGLNAADDLDVCASRTAWKAVPTCHPLVILDGLLGVGATGALRDPIREMARNINHLRFQQNGYVFAIDVPTGLDVDSGDRDEDCVKADFTCAIGFAKSGLLYDGSTNHVGRLAVLPIRAFGSQQFSPGSDDTVIAANNLAPLLPRRDFESHKTNFGRVGIVAGSIGLTGAAILASAAAVHAGAGLVRVYARRDVYSTIASAAIPETMVRPVDSYEEVFDDQLTALAAGPGVGGAHSREVLDLISGCKVPMVLDADALNIVASDISRLRPANAPRLLTPHPGEMARLYPIKDRSRRDVAVSFTKEFPVTLLFKGARTIIAQNGKPIAFNSTGNPGMGSGGMGDVLTGVCVALLGQGLEPYDAARMGSWLCGRAAELAVFGENESEESLSATAIIGALGAAFNEMRRLCL
jgi:ADP-dependent NAD(P)H-hydrate dehydratase / NAD(P)H-hydrate epimerase